MPVKTRGMRETVTVAEVVPRLVMWRFVWKNVSLAPEACEAWATIQSSVDASPRSAGSKTPSPVTSSMKVANGAMRPVPETTVKSTRKLGVIPRPRSPMMSVTWRLPLADAVRVVLASSVPSPPITSIFTDAAAPETSVNPTLVWNFESLTRPLAVACSPGPRPSLLRTPGTKSPKVPLSLCV